MRLGLLLQADLILLLTNGLLVEIYVRRNIIFAEEMEMNDTAGICAGF